MMTLTKRLNEPYRYAVPYNDHQPLLTFLQRVVIHLKPDFSTAGFRETQVATDPALSQRALRWGNSTQGFEIECVAISHPHWGFLAVESVTVTAYGLPEACSLALVARRTYEGEAGLELSAAGPDTALVKIGAEFVKEFEKT